METSSARRMFLRAAGTLTGGALPHIGDQFFNGMYPFIDAATGGNINGMILGADRALDFIGLVYNTL